MKTQERIVKALNAVLLYKKIDTFVPTERVLEGAQ